LPQVSFIIGPQASGKTTLGRRLCEKTNMSMINFNHLIVEQKLQRKNEEEQTMALIKTLADEVSPRILIEDFPQTEFQAKFFIKNCVSSSRSFVLNCSKDVCQERMLSVSSNSDCYKPSSILSKKIRCYNERCSKLLPYLREATNLCEINTEQNLESAFTQLCSHVQPTVIHVRSNGIDSSNTLRQEIMEKLTGEHDFIDLNINDLIRDESERQTELGKEYLLMVSAGKIITADMVVKMLRRNIYSGQDKRNKFLLTGFPDVIE